MKKRNYNPLVSIIVITYNSSRFVLEALESAKSQTYENIQLIVSDDASTDDTVEICHKWLDENKGCFVCTELITVPVNTGIPANCNRGLRAAKGEWIKYIAGDDTLMPNCLIDNYTFVKTNKINSVVFSYMNQYNLKINDSFFIKIIPTRELDYFFNESIKPIDQYQMLLIEDQVAMTATAFIKKECIKSIDGFDELFRMVEDYPLWLNLTRSGYKMFFMGEVTVNHRAHENNVFFRNKKSLVHPSFIQREGMRKKYIYPNVSFFLRLEYKHRYYTDIIFKHVFYNINNRLTRKFYSILRNRMNPFKKERQRLRNKYIMK